MYGIPKLAFRIWVKEKIQYKHPDNVSCNFTVMWTYATDPESDAPLMQLYISEQNMEYTTKSKIYSMWREYIQYLHTEYDIVPFNWRQRKCVRQEEHAAQRLQQWRCAAVLTCPLFSRGRLCPSFSNLTFPCSPSHRFYLAPFLAFYDMLSATMLQCGKH